MFNLREHLSIDAAHFDCHNRAEKKQVKTQCQILQGLSICIQLLCLGKAGIYNASGVAKK